MKSDKLEYLPCMEFHAFYAWEISGPSLMSFKEILRKWCPSVNGLSELI
jgi:hypothetical protein